MGIIKSREAGLPSWTVALEKRVAHLRFEVRFDPLIHAAQARRLEAQVHRALAKKSGAKFGLRVTAVRAQSLTPLPDKHD